uniref:Uncharacterized protein n=1 Tax=Alexandrium catenella TaxID=2925 RepID=A0A7S1RQT0_ALECA
MVIAWPLPLGRALAGHSMTTAFLDAEAPDCSSPGVPGSCASRGYASLASTLAEGAGARAATQRLTATVLAAGLAAALLLAAAARLALPVPTPARSSAPGASTALVGLAACAGFGENCFSSGCCSQPGMACYKKVGEWAICRPQCIEGPDPADLTPLPYPWSCELLGPRTPGAVPMEYYIGRPAAGWVATNCSAMGDNCNETRCCTDSGMTCFTKSRGWASCKAECRPGPDVIDIEPEPWSCEPLGNPTPGAPKATHRSSQSAAPWVAELCAGEGESCMNSTCCRQPGTACFRKTAEWASCRETCQPGPDLFDPDPGHWDCAQLGPRTPGIPAVEAEAVADWVEERCSAGGESCADSMCCSRPGMQCYQKNARWAACSHSCAPGVRAGDSDAEPWGCEPLGPRTPPRPAHPSLFCWALSTSSGAEAELIRYQMAERLSIFACDAWAVFSDRAFDLGDGFAATPIGNISSEKGQWGSWLNTPVFVKAWHAVFYTGQFRYCDWTVKVDPDSMFLPVRLKQHVADIHPSEPWCMHNSKSEFAGILGPIEVFSRGAMHRYYLLNDPAISGTDRSQCETQGYLTSSGEDGFISDCMKHIGVKARYDEHILSNGETGDFERCARGRYVVYHPFKTVEKYEHCKQLIRTVAPMDLLKSRVFGE